MTRKAEGLILTVAIVRNAQHDRLVPSGVRSTVLGLLVLAACGSPPVAYPAASAGPYEEGLATWYGAALAGHRTASGERFDPQAMTAAHRRLPFGTWVDVRRPDTGAHVRVRITDRGPWGDAHRVIDVSRAAAARLGFVSMGVVPVELRVVTGGTE